MPNDTPTTLPPAALKALGEAGALDPPPVEHRPEPDLPRCDECGGDWRVLDYQYTDAFGWSRAMVAHSCDGIGVIAEAERHEGEVTLSDVCDTQSGRAAAAAVGSVDPLPLLDVTAATWCPQCGPRVPVDDDGCCATCGATATGAGVTWVTAASSARVERAFREGYDEGYDHGVSAGHAHEGGYGVADPGGAWALSDARADSMVAFRILDPVPPPATTPEPPPTGDGPEVWPVVISLVDDAGLGLARDSEFPESYPLVDALIADMRARDAEGRRKYGTPLRASNGRDPLVDAYQEVLDLCAYVGQLWIETRRPVAWSMLEMAVELAMECRELLTSMEATNDDP